MLRTWRRFPRALTWLAALTLGWLALPLVALLWQWLHLPLANTALSTPATFEALRLSLITAVVATLLCALGGAPLGICLGRSTSKLAGIGRVLVMLPLVMPPVVSGVALLYVFGRAGILGQVLEAFGWRIAFTPSAVVMAQVFVALPFMVMSVQAAVRSFDERYLLVAATLGASAPVRFWRVLVPMLGPGIGAGLVLTFARCLGEFGATITFAGSVAGSTQTLPLLIALQLSTQPADAAIGLSIVLLSLCIGVVGLVFGLLWLRTLRTSRLGAPAGFSAEASPELSVPVAPIVAGPLPPEVEVTLAGAKALRGDLEFAFDTVIPGGGITAVMGPNGAGKSTLLQVIAGILQLHAGTVRFSLSNCRIGYLLQQPLLFPALTALDNVAFGLRFGAGLSTRAARKTAQQHLDAAGLGDLAQRHVGQLSGGQAQRIALLRTLATQPKIVLMDEPFAAIDPFQRAAVREDVRRHLAARNITGIMVTHSLADATHLAQHVLVIEHGAIREQGPLPVLLAMPDSLLLGL